MKHLVKNLLIAGIVILIGYLVWLYILPYFIPFVIAAILTVFIEPLVGFMQKKANMPRGLAVALSLLMILGSLSSLLTLFIARLIVELIDFSASLPRYTEMLVNRVIYLQEQAKELYFSLPVTALEFIAKNIGTVESNIGAFVNQLQVFTRGVLNDFLDLISSIPGLLVIMFVSLLATFFISKDRRLIVRRWLEIVPDPWGVKLLSITKDVFRALMGYAKAQLMLISLTFAQTLIGLLIIDAPYALLMALMVGIFDLIPILGPSTVFIPWIVWEFINNHVLFSVKLGTIYIIIIGIRQILEAKVVANAMGLHPLATLVAIYLGLRLLGPSGIVVGPLVLIGLKALARAGIINWRSG